MSHALIFDSGVGGLSVTEKIRCLLPGLHITYAADDAFRPYGNKSEAALRARLPELLSILESMTRPDVIVIACNTASTTALSDIRQAVSCPVVGVVPAIKPAARISQTKTIAVLGTPGTVRQKYVGQLISEFASDCQVILHGSVGLVDLAEAKLAGETVSQSDVYNEIKPMFEREGGNKIDAVVLACTHFPLLRDELSAAAPRKVSWIDSGEAIAQRVQTILSQLETVNMRSAEENAALLIGPAPSIERKAAFKQFGFEKVVGLVPG